MQDTQPLKAEIITLLDFLPVDSLKLLAEFAAFLRTKSGSPVRSEPPLVQERITEVKLETVSKSRQVRIFSPRLVNRDQVADFKMEVIEESPYDRI